MHKAAGQWRSHLDSLLKSPIKTVYRIQIQMAQLGDTPTSITCNLCTIQYIIHTMELYLNNLSWTSYMSKFKRQLSPTLTRYMCPSQQCKLTFEDSLFSMFTSTQ